MLYRLSTRFRTDANGRRLAEIAEPGIEAAARYYAARDYAAAARVCDAIIEQQPGHFDALHLRGVLCLEEQRPEEALNYLRRAAQEKPDEPQLLFHIGNTLNALQRWNEAEGAFRRSLVLHPDSFDTLNNLGNALAGAMRHAEAIDCFHQALAIRPNAPQALYNLGRALIALDRLEEAVESFRAALAFAGPDTTPTRLIDLHSCLYEALIQQCHYEDARAVGRSAPPSIRDAPAFQWNESLVLLMFGNYAEGWRKYEGRFSVPEHDPPRQGATVLDVGRIAGQRVLVFPEQGHGDMIQFARYLPLLAALGAYVSVETYPELKPLFESIEGVAEVVTPDAPAAEHDMMTPLLSLPLAFGTTVDSIPAHVPYLRVPAQRMVRWADLLGLPVHARVGIAWWGSQHIAKRSMPVQTLAPLLQVRGFEWHALQKEIPPADRDWLATHSLMAEHSAMLDDFADTAALIAHMDLVISIDTSVAHLAGALGIPVWIMLPFSPDWRWLRDREDSPWYPTARLFRQTRRGDWEDVVRRVVEALSVERFKYEIEGDQHGIVATDQ